MKRFNSWLQNIWYGTQKPPLYLRALSRLYGIYQSRMEVPELTRQPKPVIVVGNVVAGGSGKTPLVMHLAQLAQQHGLRVAVIARIYKGKLDGPLAAGPETHSAQVGDEPVLLSRRLNCPVIVSRKRSQSIDFIIKNNIKCDIVISDDGLQHQALPRAVEVGVFDGRRGIGNGWLMPAGPLREPAERLQRCQWLVSKGPCERDTVVEMLLETDIAVNLKTGEQRRLDDFAGQAVTAAAAIADPDGFFQQLRRRGISIEPHGYPDHYLFKSNELAGLAKGKPLFMTEKDAVKCPDTHSDNLWYVPLQTRLPETFEQAFIARCRALLAD